MNERVLQSMGNSQSTDEMSQDVQTVASIEPSVELLGAMDIVEAFTALRHELKLQVRGGRELQQSLLDSVQRLEQKVATPPVAVVATNAPESRKMAEAIADIEESLQRAIESIVNKPVAARREDNLLNRYDEMVSKAPWIAKTFAGKWLEDLRAALAHAITAGIPSDATQDSTHRGLELLLARVHRLMKQCEIERVNVLHQAFDAETMNAVDMIVDPTVPSTHVAQQLRPLYRWRNTTLRCAEVRIAT
jgi:molecular chaperone GrpE